METNDKKQFQDVIAITSGRSILIRLPKNRDDITFIRSLGFTHWDATGFCWVVQNHPANIARLNGYFSTRIRWTELSKDNIQKPDEPIRVEANTLLVVHYNNGRIRLVFRYCAELIYLIKQLPYHTWDPGSKTWTLPHTEKILVSLRDFCDHHGWKYRYAEDLKQLNRKPKPKPSALPSYRKCPEVFIEKMTILRYSQRTIDVYTDCFSEFINYYHDMDPVKIERPEIMTYLRYLVTDRCISTSYQNQAISAIKFYYEKIVGRPRETFYIERPMREKILPNVLSEEEIKDIIGSITNLKHKCMIMTAYSSGVRVGELLNLRIPDIDSKRMLIRVNQGKGRKDRVTLLSVTLLKMLRTYYIQYHPKVFLFEGASGGRYSERSVQNVLRRACIHAGIIRHTTMHTIRHSFATHLMEHNVDLRYIQELLGHTNPKTTQIYTHITTKGLDQLKSPLDNLGL
ncbi:MAG: site-specific integrase [Bacteroidota bacterium]